MLPDMGQLVDQESTRGETCDREVGPPLDTARVEPNVAVGGHDDAPRLEREPAAATEGDRIGVERRPEHLRRDRAFAAR